MNDQGGILTGTLYLHLTKWIILDRCAAIHTMGDERELQYHIMYVLYSLHLYCDQCKRTVDSNIFEDLQSDKTEILKYDVLPSR